MSEGEGLRNEIMSKNHHSLYTVHSRSTKMYKDEKRSELELRLFRLSMLHATFGMLPYETLNGRKC
jgi:hypothetical protein